MYLVICFVLCLFINVDNAAVHQAEDMKNLLAVVQVFRHGERTPITYYDTDPYKTRLSNSLNPGELTQKGKRMHYALGHFTRSRYDGFLPRVYNRKWFRAYSTDVDRTLMSIQANLAAVFLPKTEEVWKHDIPWQPIPIHPLAENIMTSISTCPVYTADLDKTLYNDPLYQNLNTNYSNTYNYIQQKSGSNISSVLDVLSVYDTLLIENRFGFILPHWTHSVYPQPMRLLTAYAYKALSYTEQMNRLAIGAFFNTIVDYFEKVFADRSSQPSFQMFSGHDSNIGAILNALEAYDPPFAPAFASTIYVELRNKSGIPSVDVWHKDDDLGYFKHIAVPGCKFSCSLEDFKNAVKNCITDYASYLKECNANIESRFSESPRLETVKMGLIKCGID